MNQIRVLVIDDSALMRKLLTEMLNADPGIDVVGSARDAYDAREQIKKLNPDVLTLDVEMPKMDGLSFLANLMRLRPMPVVMVSTLTEKGATVILEALEMGAIDFVSKPKVDVVHSLEDCAAEIVSKVKAASRARVPGRKVVAAKTTETVRAVAKPLGYRTTEHIIAIGASTGGTEAIKEVLIAMRPDSPGIVITQHIPPVFSHSFAQRMDRLSPLNVSEAKDGQQILPGHAFIAPGDRHLRVVRDGARYRCALSDDAPVNRHRPSVDVLFSSVAQHAGANAVGVILTGMGNDGANGMKDMQDAGATTVAQDEKTSVIWGMPRAAIDAGAVDRILPLDEIAASFVELIKAA